MITEDDFPKNPNLTWVIRTLNEEKWIGKVLESLFMQSRLDFEVIIVDSGSTDKTLDIQHTYPIRKIIKIANEEYTPGRSLNKGIKEARGEYIGIISAHSLPITRTWYEDALKNFTGENVVAVTGFYTALPDGSLEEKLGNLFFDPQNLIRQSFVQSMTNTNSILRKSAWEEYNFDETLEGCEDYDWACEMISRGKNIIKDPAFNVYHSHGGINRPTYNDKKDEWAKLRERIDLKRKIKNDN